MYYRWVHFSSCSVLSTSLAVVHSFVKNNKITPQVWVHLLSLAARDKAGRRTMSIRSPALALPSLTDTVLFLCPLINETVKWLILLPILFSYGHCCVLLPLTINETVKWLILLPILMQESFQEWRIFVFCKHRKFELQPWTKNKYK